MVRGEALTKLYQVRVCSRNRSASWLVGCSSVELAAIQPLFSRIHTSIVGCVSCTQAVLKDEGVFRLEGSCQGRCGVCRLAKRQRGGTTTKRGVLNFLCAEQSG